MGHLEATIKVGMHSIIPVASVKCFCGWETGACGSWAEAGKALDDHIAAERKQAQIREENEDAHI